MNPNVVTPETAMVLRERMKQCKSLIYTFSENASDSKWMPWELGYFDALKNSRVAVYLFPRRQKMLIKGHNMSEFTLLYNLYELAARQKMLYGYTMMINVIYDRWLRGYNPSKY